MSYFGGHNINLFEGIDATRYFSNKASELEKEVAAMTNESITTCDIAEWENYLIEKYSVDPIIIYENNIERTLKEQKIQVRNKYYSASSNYRFPEFYTRDGYCITYKVYYDGNCELLRMHPSQYMLLKFPVEYLSTPQGDKPGYFEICFTYEKEILDRQSDILVYVMGEFQREFASYKSMIEYVNRDAQNYNQSLRLKAQMALKNRKDKASAFARIGQLLEIPLTPSSSAPNVTPIPLKRIVRTPPVQPSAKKNIHESCISDGDYHNINNIIYTCGTAMEASPRGFSLLEEEELRDHLLATLNTHYDHASGETFRKNGKTDIHIAFENKAAYIGECKIWKGEKAFSDAVTQLMGYSTWRDVKVSLIVFNKHNQDFISILNKIDTWLKHNTTSHKQEQKNRWQCKYYRNDTNVEVELCVMVFDIFTVNSKIEKRK